MTNLVDAIGSWGRKIERRRQLERDLHERAVLAAEHTVDLLEKNAAIQARLLADTARQRNTLVQAIREIKQATIDGRVCDDVAWFDTITTLHDFCDQTLALVTDDVSAVGESK